jgi:hypothetical protein
VPILTAEEAVARLSNVGKLVHLAMRMDMFDEEALRADLLRQRRRVYEDELDIQAARVKCQQRRARLNNGAILSHLNEMGRRDAASIVHTFNRDLAFAIANIRAEVPTANRYVYAYRLRAWSKRRWSWKEKQIGQMTEGTTRAKAQQDFYDHNGHFGTATLRPRTAVCPVCKGWVARGEVPLQVAQNNPPPYHQNCPHGWSTRPDAVAKEDCPNLWMGE